MDSSTHSPFFSRHSKPLIIWASIAIVILALGIAYWWSTMHTVSTDDAYLNANVIRIASEVPGKIYQVPVANNHYVTKGSLLFSIDPAPYLLKVDQAQAQLALHSVNQNEAAIKIANAQLAEAEAALQNTLITAPASGWISNASLQAGDIVNANMPLFALISDEKFWVDANFKETQLQAIKIGQPAQITLDMYPGKTFTGTVQSISRATGSAFSLLPAQNATGNWVKITQRVPVQVSIDADPNFPLRIGTSATVTITTDEPKDQSVSTHE